MPFAVLTPIPATLNALPNIVGPPISIPYPTDKPSPDTRKQHSDNADMSSHPSSPANRLKLHSTPSAASRAARDSIISSSAKGWSPLQINKRDASPNPSIGSNPTSPSPGNGTAVGHTSLSAPSAEGPRRTSNSFKHVTRNSLVANSPFKNTSTVQGAQAAGLDVDAHSARRDVIHERRAPGESRQLGQALPTAKGAAATSKAEIGLGIGIPAKARARIPSGGSASPGSAVSGQRRVSAERSKVAVSIPRSVERRSSGSKENDSPDARGSGRKPRQSGALTGLTEHSYVSKSPFKAGPSAIAARGDSPTPSPKHGNNPRTSISPRRSSSDRKVSPGRSLRTSPSPTPSPPRHFSHSTSLGAGPSPLRGATLGPPRLPDERSARSPSPTPAKSAMTPSRRLLGPRSVHPHLESPSKQPKTVTFQSVPDVKEFERMSIEGSADGSFDVDMDFPEGAEEWEDEHEGDDSLEGILDGAGLDRAMGGLTILQGEEGDIDMDTVDDHGENGESTTANFLMEQGIFTPEADSAPVMPEQNVPDVPPIPAQHARVDLQSRLQGLAASSSASNATSSTASSHAPCLSTPSFGGSIDLNPSPVFPEKDEMGVPYGRTHHAERNAHAHAQAGLGLGKPIPIDQGKLPANTEHTMLLNGNVAQPALPIKTHSTGDTAATAKDKTVEPHAHQSGPFHDPFITIQTATAVLSPSPANRDRTEDGVPLGRTSHMERMNAARQLASQGIGLGLPRSPARMEEEPKVDVRAYPKPPTTIQENKGNGKGKKVVEVDLQSESGTEIESGDEGDDDDRFFGPAVPSSQTQAQDGPGKEKVEKEEVKGYHPPMQLDVPPSVVREAPKEVEKRSSKLGLGSFNLPAISTTSPFFSQTPAFGDAAAVPEAPTIPAHLLPHNRIPSNDPSEPSTAPSDDDRPLTPPPARPLSYADERKQGQKDDSPHRIPSLEFEAITFESEVVQLKRAEVRVNPYSPEEARFEPLKSAPPATAATNGKSDTAALTLAPREVKVRQRISREMIRERIDKKYEEGSISRRPTSMYASAAGAFGEAGMIASGSGSGLSASTSGVSASTSTSTSTSVEEKRNSGMKGYSTTVLPPTLSASQLATARTGARPTRPMSAFGALSSTAPVNAGEGINSGAQNGGRNKALPTPPQATPMQKSATEIPSIPAVSISAPSPASKTTTPIAATFSTSAPSTPAPIGPGNRTSSANVIPAVPPALAMDQIQRSAKSGTEPKSALDKLISNVLPKPKRSATSDGAVKGGTDGQGANRYLPAVGAARPVGILQNPTGRLSSQTVPTLNVDGLPGVSTGQEVQGDGNERGLPVRASSMLPPPRSDMGGTVGERPKSDIQPHAGQGERDTAPTLRPLPKPSAQPQAQTQMSGQGRPEGSAPKQRNVSGISLVSVGSMKGRRSMSMSDAAVDDDVPLSAVKTKKQPRLTLGLGQDKTSMSDAFKEEMESINTERGYKVKERNVQPTAYFGTVTHPKAGDIERGKAWRQVRRPSDIYEHAAEIRARKEGDKGSAEKATGTVFVKVLGIESLGIPIPVEPTAFCVELDNGIDYIKTSYMRLAEGARVNQEFALVEQPNFSFSLSLVLRRDPHILRLQEQERVYFAQLAQQQQQQHHQSSQPSRAPTPSSRQPSLALPPGQSRGGLKGFFSSPRKPKSTAPSASSSGGSVLGNSTSASSAVSSNGSSGQIQRLPLPPAPKESIASYLPAEGSTTFAKTHISFKPIAKQCEAKVLEIRYPMFAMFKGEPERRGDGQASKEVDPNAPRKQVAKITLQMFRLPPLPGLTQEEMPQCIDECLRGMRHHAWHQCEYHEGVLTQQGGDLRSLRRRVFKLIGGRMVAWNESKQKEVVTIDLKHAAAVVDLNPDLANMSPASKMTRMTSWDMDDEGYGVARPNSFRVDFDDGEAITFSADNKAEKARWMEALEGLLGKIPSNPLWAEVLATRQREQREHQERKQMRSASRSTVTSSNGHSSSGNSNTGTRAGGPLHTAERARMRSGKDEGDVLAGRKGEGVV